MKRSHGFSFPIIDKMAAEEKEYDFNKEYEDGIRPLMNDLPIALVAYHEGAWESYCDDTTRPIREPFNEALQILLMHISGQKFAPYGHGIIILPKTSTLLPHVKKFFDLFKQGVGYDVLSRKESFDINLSRIEEAVKQVDPEMEALDSYLNMIRKKKETESIKEFLREHLSVKK